MYCPNCGMPASPESRFCTRCGTRLPVLEPKPAPIAPETVVPEEPEVVTASAPEAVAEPETEEVLPAEPETEEALPAEPENEECLPAEPEATEEVLPVETEAEEGLPAETEAEESLPAEPETEEGLPAEPEEIENVAPVIPLQVPPAPKKGRLWPPIVCLCAIFLIGLIAFFTLRSPSAAESEPSVTPTLPQTPGVAQPFQQIEKTPWFSVQGGTLYFDPSLYTGKSDLIVPMSVDGKLVTSISDRCFQDCTELTSVSLPSTLTSIGSRAFAGCTSLRGINVSDGMVAVGNYAFSGCTALEAVHLPGSLEKMGKNVFDDCTYLRFIFFDGTLAQWDALCRDFINPFTSVSCTDGIFYQGVPQS